MSEDLTSITQGPLDDRRIAQLLSLIGRVEELERRTGVEPQAVGILDDNLVEIDSPNALIEDDEYAKFTVNGLEGRSYAEVKSDLDLEIGTDVLAQQTIGIADDNLVEVDGSPNDDEWARFTANGLEGLTNAELITALTENLQDLIGAMVTGNTETGITVTYQDGDGTIDFVVSAGSASIATGSYTGDGSTGLAVTGVGFQPKWVWITEKKTTHAATPQWGYVTDVINDDLTNCMIRGVAAGNSWLMQNCINSLDADGFTVNDGGANYFPNTASQDYNYVAIG